MANRPIPMLPPILGGLVIWKARGNHKLQAAATPSRYDMQKLDALIRPALGWALLTDGIKAVLARRSSLPHHNLRKSQDAR